MGLVNEPLSQCCYHRTLAIRSGTAANLPYHRTPDVHVERGRRTRAGGEHRARRHPPVRPHDDAGGRASAARPHAPSGIAAPPPKPSVAPSSEHHDPTHREADGRHAMPCISWAGPCGTRQSKKESTQMKIRCTLIHADRPGPGRFRHDKTPCTRTGRRRSPPPMPICTVPSRTSCNVRNASP